MIQSIINKRKEIGSWLLVASISAAMALYVVYWALIEVATYFLSILVSIG